MGSGRHPHPWFLRVSDGGSQLRAPPGVQPCSEFLPGPEGGLLRRSPQPSSMARVTVGSICAGDALRTRRAHLSATRHPQALEMGARSEPPAAHCPERRGASPSVSEAIVESQQEGGVDASLGGRPLPLGLWVHSRMAGFWLAQLSSGVLLQDQARPQQPAPISCRRPPRVKACWTNPPRLRSPPASDN